ncbi:MAG: cbb3-type cytochrome c oxidase subunit 3 [Gammaproteobacteria bacterium]|nr:cbb3-type cytochrome c oxidase subunit 3 [Gammaproteobacteria bacterium]
MDIHVVRGLYTLLLLIVFVAIWAWAWSGKRKARFEEASQLPFADESPVSPENGGQQEGAQR